MPCQKWFVATRNRTTKTDFLAQYSLYLGRRGTIHFLLLLLRCIFGCHLYALFLGCLTGKDDIVKVEKYISQTA